MRRALLGLAFLVLGLGVIVGVEIWLALRREYLSTDELVRLDRAFGPVDAPVLRFVVLGDSTSVGLGAGGAAGAYPTMLAKRLAEETGRRVELTVLGESGARVGDVLQEQAPRVAALRPDLTFIGIGANDVTHLTPLQQIRRDLRHIIELLRPLEGKLVIAGAPDMRAIAWHQPLRQVAYLRGKQVTAAMEEVAREEGIGVVELAEKTGHFFAEDPEAHFSEDLFHPSALGYRRWADAIFPALIGAVDAQGISNRQR